MNILQDKKNRLGWVVLALFLIVIISPGNLGYAGGREEEADVEFSELARAGEPLYLHYCAHCHGVHGEGDGYNAENLDKDPAELADHAFISKKTNKRLYRAIAEGGKAVKKSYLMPVFGHTLSEKEIWSLVAYIRVLGEDKKNKVVLPPGVKTERPSIPHETHQTLTSFLEWFRKEGNSEKHQGKGEDLFRDKLACFACHSVEDEGGRVGPELTRAGYLYKPEWLYVWIKNPQHARPKTRMPNLGLDEDQVRSVVTYLESLQGEDEMVPEEWKPYLDKPGDAQAGEKLFFDTAGKANCSKCHAIHGKGGHVGPDLSLVGTSRRPEFLLESILDPKAVITVGYSSVLILTKEGKFLTGIKVNEDDESLDIIDKEGNSLHVEKSLIKKFKTQKISIMPGNFKDILADDEVRNLLAFLTSLTLPEMK